jgi:hypothetical protein
VQRFRRTAQYITKAELPESVEEHPGVMSIDAERVRMCSLSAMRGAVRRA